MAVEKHFLLSSTPASLAGAISILIWLGDFMCEVDGVCFLKVFAGWSGCDGELKCSLWHFLSNIVHVPNKRQTISLQDEYVCGTNKPVKAITRVKELPA